MRVVGWQCVLIGFALAGCGTKKADDPDRIVEAERSPVSVPQGKATNVLAFYIGPWRLKSVPALVKSIAESDKTTFAYEEDRTVSARLEAMAAGNLGSDPDGRPIRPSFFEAAGAGGYQALILTENGPFSQNDKLQNLKPSLERFAGVMDGLSRGSTVWIEETWPCRDTGTDAGCRDDLFSVKSRDDWPHRVYRDMPAWDGLWFAVGQGQPYKSIVRLLPTARHLLRLAQRGKEGKVKGIAQWKDLFATSTDLSPAAQYFVALVHYRYLFRSDSSALPDQPVTVNGKRLDPQTVTDLRRVADEDVPQPEDTTGTRYPAKRQSAVTDFGIGPEDK